MSARRSSAPRKRPAQSGAGVAVPVAAAVESAADGNDAGDARGGKADAELRAQALKEYEEALRAQPDLDEEGLGFLLEHYRQALEATSLDAPLTEPDPEVWIKTLNELAQSGALTEDDRNELARQVEDAFKPLQGAEARLALEFAQRLQRDGSQQALEWLSAQDHNDKEGAAQAAPASDGAPRLRQSITSSRSRRLRGPPKG